MVYYIRKFIFLIMVIVVAGGGIFLHHIHSKLGELKKLTHIFMQEKKINPQKTISIPPAIINAEQPPCVQLWKELQPRIKDTVVQIYSQVAEFNWLQPWKAPRQAQSTGSGFFISDHGFIITNAHVVLESRYLTIKVPSQGKRQFDVDVIALSTDRDLALLKLRQEGVDFLTAALGKIPHLSLGNSDEVGMAEEIMVLGYPLGQSFKGTTGSVSGREHLLGNHLIQIDAPINPGSSGGPAVNKKGEVIGVTVAGVLQAQNVGFIIPSDVVLLFLDQIQKLPVEGEKIIVLHKPFLGVSFCNVTDELTSFLKNPQPGGLYVVEVYKSSPLDKAGVIAGDMIYEIDGYRVDLYGELPVPWSAEKISFEDYISRLVVGDIIQLVIYRKGERKEITAVLTEPDPLEWPLRKNKLPGIDYDINDYEIIGGICIASLARNHLPLLVQSMPRLSKFAEIENQMEPLLVITDVLQGSSAFRDRLIVPGCILDKVNDIGVKTLSELRVALRKSIETGFLKIETQEKLILVFSLAQVVEEAERLAKENFFRLSPTILELKNAAKTA